MARLKSDGQVKNMEDNERREKTRYPVRDSSAVLLSPENIVSYALLDISESGLAFAYNGPGTEVTLDSNGRIDLFGEVILVSEMKIKIISDKPLAKEDISRYLAGDGNTNAYDCGDTALYLRRCGVQFVDMAQTQAQLISNYLKQLDGDD